LAEQVGYAHPNIRYVYAFDPSPVTGFFDVSALVRAAYNEDHGIDRAGESKEIRSLPRHPGLLFPLGLRSARPHCPHMEGLTENLRLSAAVRGQAVRPVEGYSAAANAASIRRSHTLEV
jgi:hypothetical protein